MRSFSKYTHSVLSEFLSFLEAFGFKKIYLSSLFSQSLAFQTASPLDGERSALHRSASLLCVLLFQTFSPRLLLSKEDAASSAAEAVERCSASVDAWTRYRVSRSAARYGHHRVAAK